MNRKPKRRHSVELDALDEQGHRPFRYILREERSLLPRPRFYSKCPDARGISLEHAEFIQRHIVQQEELEREKRESERRRRSELPIDITGKPKRVIPVDPIISPLIVGKIKFQERIHIFLTGHLNNHHHQIQIQIQKTHCILYHFILQRDPHSLTKTLTN